MASFHICHIIPDDRLHGLNGYKEVIETVGWGLVQMGHTVSYMKNLLHPEAINIVFGAQLCPVNVLEKFPRNTIIYNLEQKRWLNDGRPIAINELAAHTYLVENFTIWDYSTIHIPIWENLSKSHGIIKHVPVGYAPILSRITSAQEQDIDVLIYGSVSEDRVSSFQSICALGMRSVFVCGLYGRARDDLIARSKVVLNISQYDRTFEIVRVSYLLANNKAVVASIHESTSIDADMVECAIFSLMPNIADSCRALVEDNAERQRLEVIGRQIIERRDIRIILHNAFNITENAFNVHEVD